MRRIADEQIDVVADTVTTLTKTLLDQAGGSKVTRARIENSPTSDTQVIWRLEDDPVAGPPIEGHVLDPGDVITIDGYEDLVAFKMLLTGGTDASVFVTYFS